MWCKQPIVSLRGSAELRAGSRGDPIQRRSWIGHRSQAPVSILVLDEVTSKVEDEAFARYALKKYLAGEGDVLAQPTMLLAVSLEHQMLLHDYTTSKKEILDALDRHFAGADWRTAISNPQGEQVIATLLSLTGVAGATAGHEGHKNIVWIGRGFPKLSMGPSAACDCRPVQTGDCHLYQPFARCPGNAL